jgi:hypothetical protein
MTLTIQLTAASSNLATYLASYDANFTYNGNGWFSTSFTGQDQWSAGVDTEGTDNNLPSVIMNIHDYTYSPGAFNGDVESLTLGHNLEYVPATDLWVQDQELIITNSSGYMPVTTTFNQAIYSLSHGGLVDGGTFFGQSFAGLTDYFAEQGTNQTGTTGDDVLLSFAGNDVLSGNGAVSVDTFRWSADYYDTAAGTTAHGWGNDVITDFFDDADQIQFSGFGWANAAAFQSAGGSLSGNVITYADATNGLTSTITVNFDGGGTLDWSDIAFV